MPYGKVDEFTYRQEAKREDVKTQSEGEKAPPKMQAISACIRQKWYAISASDLIDPQAASDLEFCHERKRRNHHLFSIFFGRTEEQSCLISLTSTTCPTRRQHDISLKTRQCCGHTSQQVGSMVLYASEPLLESDRVNLPSR
jgi:hypothetical protein